MKYKIAEGQEIDFKDADNSFFLIGLLNEFMNRYQVLADRFFDEISWKQCFLLICIKLFEEAPTLKEVSEMMGTSHQNVKQMLIRLEKLDYVRLETDPEDKRKQRITLTEKTKKFNEEHDAPSQEIINQLFSCIDKEELEITINSILKLDAQLKLMR